MRWAVIAVIAAGCSSDGDDTRDAADTTDTREVEVGEVEVEVGEITPGECVAPGGATARFDQTPSRFTLMLGDGYRIFSGGHFPDPGTPFHVEAEREGRCRLLTFTPSLCEPSCEFGTVCVEGECVMARPEPTPIGALTLSGVAPRDVTVTADDYGGYSWQSEDRTFEVAEVGLAGASFALESCVPVPFVPIADWSQQLEARADGADVTLRWADPMPGARVYVRMTTGIGTHGGVSPVEVECEGPDDGALTLPGRFLDALFADGWGCGECGTNELERYFADEAELDGDTIQLRVSTEAWFYFHP